MTGENISLCVKLSRNFQASVKMGGHTDLSLTKQIHNRIRILAGFDKGTI